MKWLELGIQFLQATVWPAVAVSVVLIFREPLSLFLQNLRPKTIKLPGGFEVSMDQVASSAAAAGAALGKQSAEQNQPISRIAVQTIAEAAARSPSSFGRRLRESRVLWVDDHPTNNTSLTRSFENLGIQVHQATSTEDALRMLQQERYDVIVSDMSRPPDEEAGKTLLKHLKEQGSTIPVIIFAARWAAEHKDEAAAIGAVLVTNDTSEVYSRTLDVIRNS